MSWGHACKPAPEVTVVMQLPAWHGASALVCERAAPALAVLAAAAVPVCCARARGWSDAYRGANVSLRVTDAAQQALANVTVRGE